MPDASLHDTTCCVDQKKELWWLVALEASLFFSWTCWELTAPWAEPVTAPFAFAAVLVAFATLATLACHIGPALAGAYWRGPIPAAYQWLLIWIGVGYVERILTLWRIGRLQATPNELLPLLYITPVIVAFVTRSWWKPFCVLLTMLGMGILGWALTSTWRGLHQIGSPAQWESLIARGILFSAAPAVVLGWRIGRIAPSTRSIVRAGLLGIWLPLIVSVTVASLANQAGETLYARPTPARGFHWAMLGPTEDSLSAAMHWAIWTMCTPALAGVVALETLGEAWRGHKYVFWALVVLFSVAYLMALRAVPSSMSNELAVPTYEYWAWTVLALGTVAGLRSATMNREKRDV